MSGGLVLAGLHASAAISQPAPPPQRPFAETVHDLERQDPYRWMEGGGGEFDRWAQEEADWARATLDSIPRRAELIARIESLERPSARITGVQVRGDRWIYDTIPSGSSSRASVAKAGAQGEEIQLDLLGLLPVEQGPWSEVRHARVLSPDGRYLAFGTTRAGEAEPAIRIFDFHSGQLLPDIVPWPLWADSRGFRPRWLADGSGFFYLRNPRANEVMDGRDRAREGQVFLHALGTAVASDRPIFGYGITEEIEAADTLYVEGEPHARWLPVLNRKPSGREIWVIDLATLSTDQVEARRAYRSDELVPGFGIYDNKLFTLDATGAERYRVITVDLADPASQIVEALPQQAGVLGNLQVSGDGVYVVETQLGKNRLHAIMGASVRQIELPGGSVEAIAAGPEGVGAWLELTDWLNPRSGWLVRPGESVAVSLDGDLPSQAQGNPGNISELHWAVARDGVRIPYTIVRRAEARRDGSGYVLMSGYGCFGTTNSPFYWPSLNAWLERGGIFVQAGIRGGGELGSAWHKAGSDANKPTSFEDGIDIVRHVIASGWTRPGKVGVIGGSCGGATMGMTALEAPHLVGAAVLSAAALDMKRIAEATTAGSRSIREFGDPQTPEGARRIDALSPYRQLLPAAPRPALLVMNGATDYTIPLWVGGKFVAAARSTNANAPPVLWRIDWTSGHNAGRDYAAEDADMMSFMFWQLGHPDFQPDN